MSVAYCLFFGNVVLLPLWLQQYMGYTATAAGMALAPVGLLAIVLSPLVGRNVGRVDPRRLATVAFLLFALVLWMRSHFTTQADQWTILVPNIVQGAAMAFLFIPLMTLTLSGLPPERMPAASGLNNFVRITAGAFGTSVATTLWSDRAALHHAHLVEHVTATDPVTVEALGRLTAQGMGQAQALQYLNHLVDQQAYTRAVDDIFLGSSWLFLGLIALVWLARRPVPAGAKPLDAGGAH
jgi:DHA2 family multidrug resistance protein